MAAFNYNLLITGDCTSDNAGVISITPTGGTSPYTVQWVSPNLGTDLSITGSSSRTGLSGGTYVINLNDSSLPTNNSLLINVPVSTGVCVSVIGVQKTTCGLNNGSVTATTTTPYSSASYYLFDESDNYIASAVTNVNSAVFSGLSAGTYYIGVVDIGGCEATSQSFIIDDSADFDFGFYIVPNSSCNGTPIGKIYVTGQTGTSPYTYLWSTGSVASYITGLTSGNYSVEVTDYNGCSLTKPVIVTDVSPVGLGVFTSTPPTCFSSDGEITIVITGGTAPYYYSASTGNVLISYNSYFTISGLSAGQYSFVVTDAGFCSFSATTSLNAPQGIESVSIVTENSNCSNNGASITANVVGGTPPYSYILIDPSGNTTTISSNQTTYQFTSLGAGTYTITVQDSTGCYYTNEVTLIAENKFDLNYTVTGTTCGLNNGTIYLEITTGGTSPYDFYIDGVAQIIDTNATAFTYTNVSGGQHTLSVVDFDGCQVSTQTYVDVSEPLNFSLFTTSCGTGSDGTITSFITGGQPPFDFYWSDNVLDNPQEIKVTGLTAGTYSLTIIDDSGCELTRTTILDCNSAYSSYQIYAMGAEEFQVQIGTKCGLLQMLNEGFYDLTSGSTLCTLNSASFDAYVTVEPLGVLTSSTFYTTTSLADAPSDNLWYDTIQSLILSITGVTDVTIDPVNNLITVQSDGVTLLNQELKVELKITYDINCIEPITPTPTPSISETPLVTAFPTPSETPNNTPTVTPTKTQTPNPTSTPTTTATPTITSTITPTVTKTPTVTPTPSNVAASFVLSPSYTFIFTNVSGTGLPMFSLPTPQNTNQTQYFINTISPQVINFTISGSSLSFGHMAITLTVDNVLNDYSCITSTGSTTHSLTLATSVSPTSEIRASIVSGYQPSC